ncbi:hypothetical protein EJ02DRAFT_142011 [Clathrospora elynae]|uniref:Uncharacterized protein n=1 Tax=Clathrospora elynae TaxID=706981 RepID=A0A6A5SXS7_9PLEO|nr:hypothetical protein EJ02DRAFT_142011 [Clathrospora elynae]
MQDMTRTKHAVNFMTISNYHPYISSTSFPNYRHGHFALCRQGCCNMCKITMMMMPMIMMMTMMMIMMIMMMNARLQT